MAFSVNQYVCPCRARPTVNQHDNEDSFRNRLTASDAEIVETHPETA